MSVAEAMLCECVPVTTKNFALPEVVGKTGFYASYGKIDETTEAIEKALKSSRKKGQEARKYIIDNYSLKRRENNLIKTINEIV